MLKKLSIRDKTITAGILVCMLGTIYIPIAATWPRLFTLGTEGQWTKTGTLHVLTTEEIKTFDLAATIGYKRIGFDVVNEHRWAILFSPDVDKRFFVSGRQVQLSELGRVLAPLEGKRVQYRQVNYRCWALFGCNFFDGYLEAVQ